MLFPLLFLLLLSHKNASDLFGRAAVQSGTWPLGIYKNQTITLRNFNTDGSADNEGVGKILFEASLTSLTKGDLILGSTNHASTSDGRHTVGKKILELQARQDAIMAELLGLTPPSPPPPSPPPDQSKLSFSLRANFQGSSKDPPCPDEFPFEVKCTLPTNPPSWTGGWSGTRNDNCNWGSQFRNWDEIEASYNS